MKAFNKTLDNQTLVNNLDTVIKELQIPLVYGRLISSVVIGTSSSKVEHLLNQLPDGWIIVKKNGFSDILEEQSDNRFLTLRATSPVTVSIWVF